MPVKQQTGGYEAVAAELPHTNSDALVRAQALVAELRDVDAEMSNLGGRLEELTKRRFDITSKKLVELLSGLGVRQLTIEPVGNQPGYTAKLKGYYKANIASDWDEQRRAAAFNWLESNGDGDLIKNIITVQLDRGSDKLAAKVRGALTKAGVEFHEQKSVPWTTLTAWLREQTEKKRVLPLDVLGATVGQIVDVAPVKEKN